MKRVAKDSQRLRRVDRLQRAHNDAKEREEANDGDSGMNEHDGLLCHLAA
jgi:hypothetical protein